MNIFINEEEHRARAGWRLLVQFILMFLLVGGGVLGTQSLIPGGPFYVLVPAQFVGIILSVLIAARYLDHRSFFDYGINFNRKWWIEFLVGSAIAAIAITTIFVIEWSVGWITIEGYGWQTASQTPFTWSILGAFIAMLMVGFHEELFSRGYQLLNLTEGLRYPQIGTRGAVAIATLLTSTLFGVMHMFNANASAVSTFNIVLAGVILAIPYVVTGSLAISVGLHFSWNFVMAGIWGFPVSGMNFPASIVRIKQQGTEFWTGGAFGPEAGLLGLLGMAIMLGLSLVYITKAGYELSMADLFTKEHKSALKSDEQTA